MKYKPNEFEFINEPNEFELINEPNEFKLVNEPNKLEFINESNELEFLNESNELEKVRVIKRISNSSSNNEKIIDLESDWSLNLVTISRVEPKYHDT